MGGLRPSGVGPSPRPDQGLRAEQRLSHRTDFLSCYRRGRRRHGTLVTMHYHPTRQSVPRSRAGAEARLGITVSRKVSKKAVVRHRVKRRIREIFRRWPRRQELGAIDLVVHVKPMAANAPFDALEQEMHGLLTAIASRRRGSSS